MTENILYLCHFHQEQQSGRPVMRLKSKKQKYVFGLKSNFLTPSLKQI